MSSIVQCDVEGFEFILQQVGNRAVREVTEVLREEAHEIKRLAVEYAPVDTHSLENAIDVEVISGGRDSLGRFARSAVMVFVRGTDENPKGGVVDDYWLIMHELLEPYGNGPYQLGPKSQQKGGDVGGKFMERAFSDREKVIHRRAFFAVQKSLGRIK